jgi:hypothetical protein
VGTRNDYRILCTLESALLSAVDYAVMRKVDPGALWMPALTPTLALLAATTFLDSAAPGWGETIRRSTIARRATRLAFLAIASALLVVVTRRHGAAYGVVAVIGNLCMGSLTVYLSSSLKNADE